MSTVIEQRAKKRISKAFRKGLQRNTKRCGKAMTCSRIQPVVQAIRDTSVKAREHSKQPSMWVLISKLFRKSQNHEIRTHSRVQEIIDLHIKPLTEAWDVIGVDGNDIIMRRRFMNGATEEFVIEKLELESKGLTNLRVGRRIEVSREPGTNGIKYTLQKHTYLKSTPLLRSILERSNQAAVTE